MRLTTSFRSLASVAVAAAIVALPTSAASASPAPIADPNAAGYLGFCDTHHEQVRSGLLGAAPFAWTIASSLPAPEGYARGKAAVIAFQPRKGVDPGDWSGKQLTASSTFTNARHPMSSGTRIDPALVDFTSSYPTQVDGLVQLRMYFAAPNRPQASDSYPSVFVRVTGDRWTQVGGGAVDCSSGTARSAELDALPASRLKIRNPRPAPQAASVLRKQAAATSAAAASGSASPQKSGTSVGGTSGVARPVADTAAPASTTDSGGLGGWLWLPALAVLALVGTAVVVRRRRSTTGA